MDWIPIGEPDVQHLTPNQQRIRDMLDAGKSIWNICGIMRMRREHVEEEIYEIRRKEAIMARKPKFNKEQRAEMLRLHNEERYSVGKLANKFGCSQTAVKTALQAAKIEAEEQETEKKPGIINPEFDAAVNAMVADLHEKDADAEENAANAEKKSVFVEVSQPVQDPPPELEDVENGIPNTPIAPNETANQPAAVRRAIEFRIRDIEEKIEARVSKIRELKEELTDLRRESAELLAWKGQQKWK